MRVSTIAMSALVCGALVQHLQAQPPMRPRPVARRLPDAPGKELVQRVCGSTCHGAELVAAKGMNRDGWAAVVNGMISRGAKLSGNEFADVVEYLGKNLPQGSGASSPIGMGSGPNDAHIVDAAGAERGKSVYIAECITCHGPKARGNREGPPALQGADLIRSLVVLKDRYGSTIGQFLKKGHPTQSGAPSANIPVVDLAHFLHAKIGETMRQGQTVINVLTGDAKAGAAYFNGEGGCNKCHSVTGDLAGVGKKYDPPTLQQKFLFPRTFGFGRGARTVAASKPVTVKVTPAGGKTVSGVLVHLDDFNVSLRDEAGEYFSWKRTADLKVEKNDPYQTHIDLLDKYTDKNMHDIVAYLETLK